MAIRSGAAPAQPCGPQQGRGQQRAATRGVLPSTGGNSRPHLRKPKLPRVGPEPHHSRHRPLEHGLSRPCRSAVARAGIDGSRRSVGARRTPRMGAHRSDRRLRLDRGEPRRAVSAATGGSFYVPAPGRLAYDFEQIVCGPLVAVPRPRLGAGQTSLTAGAWQGCRVRFDVAMQRLRSMASAPFMGLPPDFQFPRSLPLPATRPR